MHGKLGEHFSKVAVILLYLFPADTSRLAEEEVARLKRIATAINVVLTTAWDSLDGVISEVGDWGAFMGRINGIIKKFVKWSKVVAERVAVEEQERRNKRKRQRQTRENKSMETLSEYVEEFDEDDGSDGSLTAKRRQVTTEGP